jgi:hypothetical protein
MLKFFSNMNMEIEPHMTRSKSWGALTRRRNDYIINKVEAEQAISSKSYSPTASADDNGK